MNNWTDILDVNDIPKLGARVVRHGTLVAVALPSSPLWVRM